MSEAVLTVMRGIEARLDRMGADLCDIGRSLSRTEASVAALSRTYVNMQAGAARLEASLDRIDSRLDLREARH